MCIIKKSPHDPFVSHISPWQRSSFKFRNYCLSYTQAYPICGKWNEGQDDALLIFEIAFIASVRTPHKSASRGKFIILSYRNPCKSISLTNPRQLQQGHDRKLSVELDRLLTNNGHFNARIICHLQSIREQVSLTLLQDNPVLLLFA